MIELIVIILAIIIGIAICKESMIWGLLYFVTLAFGIKIYVDNTKEDNEPWEDFVKRRFCGKDNKKIS